MPRPLVFQPATRFSVQQLAAYFTAAYEDYPYPVAVGPEQLARRVREEALDLAVSAVAELAGQPAGLFLVGRRGHEAWCGGFGVNKPLRGRGLAAPLAAEMLARTRAAGAITMRLEVLQQNIVARAAYERAGFRAFRELLILGWSPASASAGERSAAASPPVESISPAEHLERLSASALPAHAWQRAHAALWSRADVEAFRIGGASALVAPQPDGSARLLSLWTENAAPLAPLLQGMQRKFRRLMVVNEPADSPHLPALRAAGFRETDRQFEMRIDLGAA